MTTAADIQKMKLTISSVFKCAIVCAVVVLASDVKFKYLYGRSMIVDSGTIYLNASLLSVVLVVLAAILWIVSHILRKNLKPIVFLIFILLGVELIQYCVGSEFTGADERFANMMVKSINKPDAVGNIEFSSSDVKSEWFNELGEMKFELFGKSSFHNSFIYNAYGHGSYTVFIHARPPVEIKITRLQ